MKLKHILFGILGIAILPAISIIGLLEILEMFGKWLETKWKS